MNNETAQRCTGLVSAHEHGGFVAVGDYLELRAALAERDAEIERLNQDAHEDGMLRVRYGKQFEAQRKALEQAKAALEINRVMGADEDGNYTVEITPKVITAAITAIQEVLA